MFDFRKREDEFVDAIEEGKIVRVAEDYARREGLLILRKTAPNPNSQAVVQKKEEEMRKNKGFIGMEDLRRPISTKGNELLNELLENFHWILVQKRKSKGLTRKKVADSIGESELNVKIIENGVLPANNFIMVNKLESFYGVNLRKNKVSNSAGKQQLRQVIDFKPKESKGSRGEAQNSNVVIHPIKRSDGSVLQDSPAQKARTPKWVQKTDDKGNNDGVEVLDDVLTDSVDNQKNMDNSQNTNSDIDIVEL